MTRGENRRRAHKCQLRLQVQNAHGKKDKEIEAGRREERVICRQMLPKGMKLLGKSGKM